MGNPVLEAQKLGQSIWLDNISRGMIKTGELQRLVEDGVVGVTSNPSIFQKAITGGAEYDAAIAENAAMDAEPLYETVAVEDIQSAADVLRAVYDRAGARDGYVSLEVSPLLAYDTAGTIAAAKRLFAEVNRPNIMIKIPATEEGIPAIREAIAAGINVNVTLIFSRDIYEKVMEAHISGLEQRLEAGESVENIASVASFFISRVDRMVDPLIHERIEKIHGLDMDEQKRLRALLGMSAIANAKLAYQRYEEVYHGERFAKLREAGAQVQRPLWASTSTKDPTYSDVLYVETLIGPETVNTIPNATFEAFKDHGRAGVTLTANVEESRQVLDALAEIGIDMDEVTDQLQSDGVKAFADSYNDLLAALEAKRAELKAQLLTSLADAAADVDEAVKALKDSRVAHRLWTKDAGLWKDDAEHQITIRNRLGWLYLGDFVDLFMGDAGALLKEVKQAGYKQAVLMGMGGSSLASEVIGSVIGEGKGGLDLHVVDTTDPAAIQSVEDVIDPAKTLFIVGTKSGSTIETLSLLHYFWAKIEAHRGSGAGEQFIAITDPGSKLQKLGEERGFRRVYLNPVDIGGRYSALSYFGLGPAALMGVDRAEFSARANEMIAACGPESDDNPGLWLGAALGKLWEKGRDKVTIVTSEKLESFGVWAEQLIAESTGKEDKGLIPIAQEALLAPPEYGDDRVFVYMRLDGDISEKVEGKVAKLREAGFPVITLRLRDVYDLAGEFFRWEFATSIAATFLQINPFDQPNVQSSKDNTNRLLASYESMERLPLPEPVMVKGDVSVYGEVEAHYELDDLLANFLGTIESGDYFTLLAYLPAFEAVDDALQHIRTEVQRAFNCATAIGYGPRFQHSTGQLHKGGPNTGVFVQITVSDHGDLAVPGKPYSFGTLKTAQALGDMEALQGKGRRVIRLHVASLDALSQVKAIFASACEKASS